MSSKTTDDLCIVLVQPTAYQGVQSLFTHHKNGKVGIGHKPPLGVMILGTYLISKGYKNVHLIDAQLDNLTPEETAAQVAALKPDVVGFTVWTDFWYPAWQTIRLTKEQVSHCKIVLGGPHCTCVPRETLEGSLADYLVVGDGEDVMLGIVDSLAKGEPVEEAPGLWRKEGGEILGPQIDLAIPKDLAAIPTPDRLLLPYKRYTSVLNANDYETTMVTSRGCPHKCNFCKIENTKVYCRTAEQVVEEFREIQKLGITDVQVYDDTFTWSKKRVIDICKGLIENNIKVNWAIRDRVKRADPEIYALMKEAGCYRIHFGVETGSEPVLDATGKATTLQEAEEAMRYAKEAGFVTMGYYMFGFLDETYEDAQKTIDFSVKLDADYNVFNIVIPYPGTRLYTDALERKVIPCDFWLDYTLNPVADYRIPHLIEHVLSRDALLNLKSDALRRHYLRPKVILKELKSLRSFNEFKRKGSMALDILTDALSPVFSKKKEMPENFHTYHSVNS
ncbi:MAG: radical SAM protein [Nitrospinota bacterium]|nr:radical SAM protein [Nitrospinota bacterium]